MLKTSNLNIKKREDDRNMLCEKRAYDKQQKEREAQDAKERKKGKGRG